MTYPVTTTEDMNVTDYGYPSIHCRTGGGGHPQDVTFRWPTGSNERPVFNHAQYLSDKPGSCGSIRNDVRYNDLRYQYDPRPRHDTTLHEDQQRLHEYHSQQFQKSTHELRAMQTSTNDMRFGNTEIRHLFTKKYDGNIHEIKLPFDDVHIGHDQKGNFTPIDSRHRLEYPINTSPAIRPSFNEPKSAFTEGSESTTDDSRTTFNDQRYHFNNQTAEMTNKAIPSIPINNSPPYLEPIAKMNEPVRPVNQTSTSEILQSPKELSSSLQHSESSSKVRADNIKETLNINTSPSPPPPLIDKDVLETEGNNKEYLTLNTEQNKGECFKQEEQQEGSTVKEESDFVEPKDNVEGTKVVEKENVDQSDISPTEELKSPKNGVEDNGLPSYTAMIAQAILKREGNKGTLSDIYEFMEKSFPSLKRRGTGWRNCVRHTLSLNDCFIKLHRPENGRSCNWAIHPSYFEGFSRGDYRKRRALRKRPRGLQWIDPIMLGGYPFMREHEMHPDLQPQSSYYHYPPVGGMWSSSQNSYNTSVSQTPPPPSHLQHFPQPPGNMHPQYSGHPSHPGQMPYCTNPECCCQFNKNNCRVYTP